MIHPERLLQLHNTFEITNRNSSDSEYFHIVHRMTYDTAHGRSLIVGASEKVRDKANHFLNSIKNRVKWFKWISQLNVLHFGRVGEQSGCHEQKENSYSFSYIGTYRYSPDSDVWRRNEISNSKWRVAQVTRMHDQNVNGLSVCVWASEGCNFGVI